ncbi:hypothetical protein HON71_01720 [Candidatus Woesearchaeota archaeon]|jgi:hypothetical protein|nr:hypothetical protein [Candidatus Woesearchaeota archaeon]MBT5342423.1 hypothetical protein [Candidatus Woesearchaeota archaeon]MBT6774202.1 hypothetical protein [Candidatus Woesearchaeota archaeon]
MIISTLPILDFPSHPGILPEFSTEETSSLEEAIKEDFGEKGLERFKEYKIQISAPGYDFSLGFERDGDLLTLSTENPTSGRIYSIATQEIKGISAQDGTFHYRKESNDKRRISIDLDLNPNDKECQYLRLSFNSI